uniref:Protein quaking (inferred by orthology to a human protein) n=1 Tax=Strongyloides venezuelensis TaxID=75913 RepID=A0A0K0EYG7_STRVS
MQTTLKPNMVGRKFENYPVDYTDTLTPKNKTTSSTVSEIEIINKNIRPPNVTIEYLISLLVEKKKLMLFPQLFSNVDRLLDEEISRVRMALFQCDFSSIESELPKPEGDVTLLFEKVYVPVKEFPDCNFVGRILGPRGMTTKQLEQETGCRIMVRGKGSVRDKKKEEANYGKPNWEHLDEDLHVLIQCEDTPNRAKIKIKHAVKQVEKLILPLPEGSDELKRKQLVELSIINGTYRPPPRRKNLISPTNILPSFNPLSPLVSNDYRGMSLPMYLTSSIPVFPPIIVPPLNPSIKEEQRSPSPPTFNTQFDYSSSQLDNLLLQTGISGFNNSYLNGSFLPSPGVLNTSTFKDSFSYFYDNLKNPQVFRKGTTKLSDNTSESSGTTSIRSFS